MEATMELRLQGVAHANISSNHTTTLRPRGFKDISFF